MSNRGDQPSAAQANDVITDLGTCVTENTGMTIRETMAMAAMQGMLAGLYSMESWHGITDEGIAERAAEHADALLKELEK